MGTPILKAGQEQTFRSQILEKFPAELLFQLDLLSRAKGVSNNGKIPYLKKKLYEYELDYTPLGSGTNRYGILSNGYAWDEIFDEITYFSLWFDKNVQISCRTTISKRWRTGFIIGFRRFARKKGVLLPRKTK